MGALWLSVLVLQKHLQRLAARAVDTGTLLASPYQALYRAWSWLGVAGLLGMFAIVLMRVSKVTIRQWLGV
ncbi:DUF2269 family protein [Pseudomonas typographi]|uniref:DUF2269 family protein n=1 Tax=Pseudomonas typographi TaxID=2715964 RepID=UPI003B8A89BD